MKFNESTTLGQLQMARVKQGNPEIYIKSSRTDVCVTISGLDGVSNGHGQTLYEALNDAFAKYPNQG